MAAGPTELMSCSWGKIRIFAAQVHTDSGRTQVVHERSSGDRHAVQDRGLRARRVRVRIQFDNFPNAPSPRDAAIALERAKDTGEVAIFQHPLLGRFPASIGEFVSDVDEYSVITAEAEFIKEDDDIAVTPTGASSSGLAGEIRVASAAAALDAQLAGAGLLQMSTTAAAALMQQTPGGASFLSTIGRVGPTIEMNANLASAFVAKIAARVSENANRIASEAASVTGAPVATGFVLQGAAASLNALLLSPTGESLDVAGAIPAPSGFGQSDPSTTLAALASSEASQGLYAATTMDARVAVEAWSTGDVPVRRIMIDAARISNNIATMIEVGGFERDIALWPAFRAAIMLGESIRAAAIAASSETPAVFIMRVASSTSLIPLAARVYGGKAALERARQIMSLNDIATPGWLPPGDYLMPTRPAPPAF